MRLKSLEIQGFKSFAAKSILDFDRGVTAIVGPNGSGKSNIADAIRWVLGEQSYTNLRAQRTADMIFSGSDNRSRLGMAYVSIILDNSDGSLPLDYNEVTIARRAFRSGENEYLINNNRVRLRDITELLARGGLARQTYTLVGQGTIDRVLSLRAQERRQLFEEAAGTTYHRQRRLETLRRLQETHQNLLRVNDIIKEIEPRLKRLDRQRGKVAEYQTIRQHLNGLLKIWYGYRWHEGQQELHRARVRETISQERLQEAQATLQQLESSVQDLRSQQVEIRSRLGDWHAASSQIQRQAERLQRELAVGEERARQLAAQREEFLTEIETLERNRAAQQSQVDQAKATLAEITAAYQAASITLQEAEQALAGYRAERETLIQQQKQAARQAQATAHQLTERRSRLQQLAERRQELAAQQAEHQQTIQALQVQQGDLEQAQQGSRQEIEALEAEIAASQAKRRAAIEQQQTIQDVAWTLTAEMAQQEKQLASLQARRDLLSRLQSDLAGYHSGVRAVLQAGSLSGIRGTMAQLVQVPARLETAIEAAIGGRLQEVVVDAWGDAEAAIEHLKIQRAGRATFLPLDTLKSPNPLIPPQTPGVIGLATELVTFDASIALAAESILNRVLVVEDLSAARRAFQALRGSFQITTLAGEIVRSGGSVTGGEARNDRQGSSFLAREREWRELPKQIQHIKGDLRQLRQQLKENKASQKEIDRNLVQIEQHSQQLQQGLARTQALLREQEATRTDIVNQLAWQVQISAKASAEIDATRSREATYQADIERLNREQQQAQEQAADLATQVEALSSEALVTRFNEARAQATVFQQKRQGQEQLLQNYTEILRQTDTQRQHRQDRIKALGRQRATLLDQLATRQANHQGLLAQISRYTEQIEPAEQELHQLEAEQSKLEEQEIQGRGYQRRLEAEKTRFSLDLARQQDKMTGLQRQIEDDFGLVQLHLSDDQVAQPVLPIQSMVTQLPTVSQLPEGTAEDIRHLKIQLRQLGNINPDAPKEYAELKERHDFLTGQLADLEAAADNLRSVIDELDKVMEKAFTQTFTAVAQAFQSYFKLLFNGGEAQLILSEPENLTDTGIEIVARPPGKRLQSLELLSGGERSLTAQALIFALLRTSPTPYCIFDEVDAMLDEANVERFRKALLALSKDIQFVVITHNRKTIEIANAIYGVFMNEDAISKPVSRKLDEFSEEELQDLT